MKLWECNYKVSTGYEVLSVQDYIWSTTQPQGDTVGHYWRTLFPDYTVSDGVVVEVEYFDGMNTDAVVLVIA